MILDGYILESLTYQTPKNNKHKILENTVNVVKTFTQEINLIGIYY